MSNYSKSPLGKETVLDEPAVSYAPGSYYRLSSCSISKKYVKQVLRLSKLSVTEMISLVPISIDTYKRKRAFKPVVTEKILEIEEVYNKGLEAFGGSFHSWMNTENLALGGTPKSFLNNSFGVRLLLNEIGRLEHGVLA